MLKWIVKAFFLFIAIVAATLLITNIWVIKSTEDKLLIDFQKLPKNSVALVLGTSSKLADGSPNQFFENRIKTAAILYKNGKATRFIVSGDNRSKYYNEPLTMKKALMKHGVPEKVITLDYAGLRTLDSIVRTKEVFGQNKIVIITQPFHCYRALFISHYYHLDALAMGADEPSGHVSPKVYWREYFARTKAVLDLYILKTLPRHLGNKQSLAF